MLLHIDGRLIAAQGDSVETQPTNRRPYSRPEIVHELALETRAGSPLFFDPLDPPNPMHPLNPVSGEPKR